MKSLISLSLISQGSQKKIKTLVKKLIRSDLMLWQQISMPLKMKKEEDSMILLIQPLNTREIKQKTPKRRLTTLVN